MNIMPEISRTHLRHISSLELALIRYTQVTQVRVRVNLSIPTRGSAGGSRPLSMSYSSVLLQQKKLGGGRKVEKVPPPLLFVHLRGTMFWEKNVSL